AVLYCRVSSKEQEETGYSLPAQEKLLTEYADREGFAIAPRVFKVSESASGKQIRKTFVELLEYAEENGINVILCEKTDRLTRNLKDAAIASDWVQANETRQIHFVKENSVVSKNTKAHENLVWDMKVAIARFYTNNLSEEVKKGQEEKIRQGWIPTRAKLGYMTTGERGHKTHVPDPKTAPFMRRAFELYATGNYSIKALANQLYKEGLRSPSGNRLVKSRLDDMLRDEFYCGNIVWNDMLRGAGKHEPLVSQGLFEQVQAILSGRKAPHFQRRNFAFRKLMTCGECGSTITAEMKTKRQKNGNIHTYVYYHCSHYRDCSQKVCSREEEVEKQILRAFQIFEALTPEEAERIRLKIKQNHAEEVAYKEHQRSELQSRYNVLGTRKEKLFDAKLDGEITAEHWKRKETEIDDERTAILKELEKIQSKEAKYYELWQNILDLALRAKEIYLKRSPDERRVLIAQLFSALRLKNGEMTYELKPPVRKLAERIQKGLDIEILEPMQKAAKGGHLQDISVNNIRSSSVGVQEPRNNFRTSENPL
ncbi:MAG: recombinase family protein, partial [Patescibacteria group bacterium]|nr:recombinase family protein [Patescibacteria group bacterium]